MTTITRTLKQGASRIEQTVHNNTSFSLDQIWEMKVIGQTSSSWRGRIITLHQHPSQADRVVSVGTTFDSKMVVVADEPKTDWANVLNA